MNKIEKFSPEVRERAVRLVPFDAEEILNYQDIDESFNL